MLPEVSVDSSFWFPNAKHINDVLRDSWGVESTVLRCLATDRPDLRKVFVAHSQYPVRPPSGMSWINTSSIASLPFSNPGHQKLACSWLAGDANAGLFAQDPLWASPVWIAEASAWISGRIAALDHTIIGSPEQVKSWSISSVLRVKTSGGFFYFKAVPPHFQHEPRITLQLSILFPTLMPRVVAIDPDRRWLLMSEFAGPALRRSTDLADWAHTLRTFAQLQIDCISRTEELLAWGCADRRIGVLASQAQALMWEMTDLDALCTYCLSPDDAASLRARAPEIDALCRQLSGFGISETLIHGDLHGGNVSREKTGDSHRTLFFDWTDAAVSHPFFDLQTMLQEEWIQNDPNTVATLQDAYLEPWSALHPGETLIDAYTAARKLAPLHHAISYRGIVQSLSPSAYWEHAESVGHFLRRLLAGL